MDLLTWETVHDMEEELLFLNLSSIFSSFLFNFQTFPPLSCLPRVSMKQHKPWNLLLNPGRIFSSLDSVPGVVLLSLGSTVFAPLWEEHQVSKLTSCCCSTLIALLFFIAVVNVLLYLTNELNSERHTDREKNMACMVWDTWCFRCPVSPRNKSL